MAYECRIYDKNGKLVRTVSPKEILVKLDKTFFGQKSTMTAAERVKTYKDPKLPDSGKTKFFNRFCIFCNNEFFSRHPYTKYCSHECQKKFYIRTNKGIQRKMKGQKKKL